ncbi:MAG: hypothetical protein MK132_09065 [Lentisphaerales bacterium]|nr:hypothetical protein [Lentisphaerales bacterium]
MLHLEQQDCSDTLKALESLEGILEETIRITERILTRDPLDFDTMDAWNEEIEAENHYHTEKISDLYKDFKKNERVFDFVPDMTGWSLISD